MNQFWPSEWPRWNRPWRQCSMGSWSSQKTPQNSSSAILSCLGSLRYWRSIYPLEESQYFVRSFKVVRKGTVNLVSSKSLASVKGHCSLYLFNKSFSHAHLPQHWAPCPLRYFSTRMFGTIHLTLVNLLIIWCLPCYWLSRQWSYTEERIKAHLDDEWFQGSLLYF